MANNQQNISNLIPNLMNSRATNVNKLMNAMNANINRNMPVQNVQAPVLPNNQVPAPQAVGALGPAQNTEYFSGTMSIFGQEFQKTHVYIIGLIILIIVGYMVWTWYKKNQDEDDEFDDDISYTQQMQHMVAPQMYQHIQPQQRGYIRKTVPQQLPQQQLPQQLPQQQLPQQQLPQQQQQLQQQQQQLPQYPRNQYVQQPHASMGVVGRTGAQRNPVMQNSQNLGETGLLQQQQGRSPAIMHGQQQPINQQGRKQVLSNQQFNAQMNKITQQNLDL